MPRALITGITGQDGSYLAEFLLAKGYQVHGLVRSLERAHSSWLKPVLADPAVLGKKLFLHPGDLASANSLRSVMEAAAPDEVYHLAGQTHVGLSFELVESTCDLAAMGTLRLLEAARNLPRPPKVFNASSSEIFGRPEMAPQDENTRFEPVTPYGCAKAFATRLVSVYRRRFGLFACNGILYNHESPRRGENFVTRKICLGAAAIKEGRQKELLLGNLASRRDWGDAREYVRGMWLALQHGQSEDFVFATGQTHTVQEVAEIAFEAVGLDWKNHVRQDPKLMRPEEPGILVGNPAKARQLLGWEPGHDFKKLITEMTLAAVGAVAPSATPKGLSRSSFIAGVAGLCLALTALTGCKAPASIAEARKDASGPIRQHPVNPHYFAYKGQPQVLITTDQHYGAVMNLDFDYIPFLDRLHEYGMNLTRIYPGAYVEMKDQYAKGNPLGPAPGRYLLPWKKSEISGANTNLGSYKYDLDTWDEAYFARLKDYVRQAALRDIIVEIAFFNGMYDDRWAAQPLYHANNIQGVGTCAFRQYTTLADKPLVEAQLKYVKKIASELIEFDNLIYDISDEPEMQRQDSRAWNSAMLDALISVDHYRHMYGETAHSASPDFTKDPRVSWLPTEYISPMETTLDTNYPEAKPIINVETGYYPFWYGHPVEETRAEGWYGMVGGLAGIIHLNADFSTFNPSAKGTSTEREVLPQKRALMNFMRSLDFVRMTKFTGFRVADSGALARGIAQPGKQYALYIFHGTRKWDNWPQGPTASRFNAEVGWFTDRVSIELPRGSYSIGWINPATGEVIASAAERCAGGELALATPLYRTDIALKITRLP